MFPPRKTETFSGKKIGSLQMASTDFERVFNLNWSGFQFDKTNIFLSATKGTLELFKICNETTVKKLQ